MQVNALRLAVVLAFLAAAARGDPATAVTPNARPAIPLRQAVLLNGKPFPPVTRFTARVPEPVRVVFVSASVVEKNGDGTSQHPWNDLQAALAALSPGDRLRVLPGVYTGAFAIDERCKDGSAQRPIQVFFDGKASLAPRGDGAALTIRKAHWHLSGLFVELGQTPNVGVSLEGLGAHEVTLDGARISSGAGPSIRIGAETARITVANSRIAKSRLEQASPDAVGIVVEAGAQDVLITNNQLHENPGGSLRVRAPAGGGRPAGGLRVLANAIHDDATAAIDVAAGVSVRISKNTIFDAPGSTGTVGIALGRVEKATVDWNSVFDCETAVSVGRASPGEPPLQAADVSIDHNDLEQSLPEGTAVRVESANGVRLAHNVVDGPADAFLILGAPPRTRGVTVANNLVLRVSGLAFALDDRKSAELFDYNLFSPAGASVDARLGDRRLPLTKLLKEGAMPHTKVVSDVRILNHDLARIAGAQTVGEGTPLKGFAYKGAPDIGVEER